MGVSDLPSFPSEKEKQGFHFRIVLTPKKEDTSYNLKDWLLKLFFIFSVVVFCTTQIQQNILIASDNAYKNSLIEHTNNYPLYKNGLTYITNPIKIPQK